MTMRSPIDEVRGRVVGYDERSQEVIIRARYEDWINLFHREYEECLIRMIDSRPASDKQRKAIYALIREISDNCGMGVEEVKLLTKRKFLVEDLNEPEDTPFSLATCSMSMACAYQAFLIDFVISMDIPTKLDMAKIVDDVERYVYTCMRNKKCCICGKPAFLHHHDRVGMGRNREEIVHIGMLAEPLCWEHHTEAHTKPQAEFDAKYHIQPVKIDKTIAKLYELNEEENEIIEGEMNDEQDYTDWQPDP